MSLYGLKAISSQAGLYWGFMKPYMSIIIPAKNEEKVLPRLVDSIHNQTFKEYEVIVADAHSTDKTREIAKDLGCNLVDGGRPDKGRNNGARIANPSSKYFCFIDADAVFSSDTFLEKSVDELEGRGLDLAGTLQKPLREDSSLLRHGLYNLMYEIANFTMCKKQNTSHPLMVSCMFASRDAHENIGGFKPLEFGEDSKYAIDGVALGYTIGILQSPGRVLISPRRITNEGILPYLIKDLSFVIKLDRGEEVLQSEREEKGKYWTD